MKRKIVKYKQFIVESDDNSVEKIIDLREKFHELLLSLENLSFTVRSYSDCCKTKNDPNEDFEKIQEFMDSNGFTLSKIKYLFSEENNKECGYDIIDFYFGDNSQLSSLNSECASVDIYLYKLFEILGLDKDIIALGGDGWATQTDEEEVFIRYRYGYHKTKYGKMMLDQMKISEEKFIEISLAGLKKEIADNLPSDLFRLVKFNKTTMSIRMNYIDIMARGTNTLAVNFDKYSIIENDRLVIFVKELLDHYHSLGVMIYMDELVSILSTELDFLNVIFTGEELIIS